MAVSDTRSILGRRPCLAWGLVLLAAFIPHAPYLFTYFFMDDYWHLSFILDGDYIFSTWSVGRDTINQLWYMTPEVFPQMGWVEEVRLYFRPFFAAGLVLDYKLFGLWAPGWHLHSLLWHLLNVALLFSLLRRMGVDSARAVLAAVALGLHPVAVEPVGWISARCYLQLTACLLSATHFWLSYQSSGRIRWQFLHLGVYLLALGSHEVALVYPAVLGTFSLVRRRRGDIPKNWAWVPTLLVALGFFSWRLVDQSGDGAWSMATSNFGAFKIYGPLAVLGYNLAQYTKLALIGFPTVGFVALDPPLSAGWTVALLIGVPVALLWGWRWRERRALLWWAWSFFFVAVILWIPSSGRYLYPAAPGLAACLALALPARATLSRVWATLLRVGLPLLVAFWMFLSLVFALASLPTHRVIQTGMQDIRQALAEHPQAEDLYLFHLWPLVVNSEGFIGELSGRPHLKVHVMTYASSLHVPDMSEAMRRLTLWVYPIDPKWMEPLEITTQRLNDNEMYVKSVPYGFFTGPAAFGWNRQSLPVRPHQRIDLPQMTVRSGPLGPESGVRWLRFAFKRPLNDPRNLWMVWRDGHLQVWEP